MRFLSPSGRYTVEVLQTRIANEYGFGAILRSNRASYQLCDIRREAIIYFVHVAWSQNESRVGIVASGVNHCQTGFDLESSQLIQFSKVQDIVAASIRSQYSVPSEQNAIDWAMGSAAGIAFKKAHPEIQLTYRD